MALFNRWKNTVEKLTHPVVQEEKNTEVATEDEAKGQDKKRGVEL